MSSWEMLLSLDESAMLQLQDIYTSRNFPFEIRGHLASWIEAQPWLELDEGKVEHCQKVQELYDNLIGLIEEQKCSADLMTQMRFIAHIKTIKDSYDGRPWQLATTIGDILRDEQALLDGWQQRPGDIQAANSPEIFDVGPFIQQLKDNCQLIEADARSYKQDQEDFVFKYQDVGKLEAEKSSIEQQVFMSEEDKMIAAKDVTEKHQTLLGLLKHHAAKMLDNRETLLSKMERCCTDVDNSCKQVFEDLFRWKLKQQKSMSGGPDPPSLDDLQLLFEDLADLLWKLCNLSNQMKYLYNALPVPRIGNEKERIDLAIEKSQLCLTDIILKSFVVDKQPPQVLKTQTRFQASVRLLVGRQLNVSTNCPEVVTTILSEKQAKDVVHGTDPAEAGNCGDLLNSRSVMEFHQATATLHADFKNLSLRRIKRQDRRVQESVLEAKSALVFSADVTIGGRCLPVRCMSLPVVVVVHGNQGPNSEATIVWDNMFSLPDREPFDVPDEVPWCDMKEALNARWRMTTGKDLTELHLAYLGAKLFPDCPFGSYGNRTVSWSTFNKEPLSGRNFTFWEWFHGAMEVVKKHLKDHWLAGQVEFVTRSHGQECLRSSAPGTFIIRFSDGEIGGVTISWVQPSNEGVQKAILHLQPWSSKDFIILSLADRIFDLQQLQYLYPNIPKQEAFERFRSREPSSDANQTEYVSARIMARIEFSRDSPSTVYPFSNSVR